MRKLLQTLKLGLRGIATVFIPLFAFPIIGNFFGLGVFFQCGLLIRVPLIVVWIQTFFAWGDDILRWIGR